VSRGAAGKCVEDAGELEVSGCAGARQIPLDVEWMGGCWLLARVEGREVRTRVPSCCEGGQARLPRHLFAHVPGAWCGSATTARGSITYVGRAACAGAMPFGELA
jgi:hypothetical protein